MGHEQFDPNAWRLEKYGKEKLSRLTPREYQARLRRYEDKIKNTILKTREEFRKKYGANYDIVGAAIFGSWTRGDPHKKSDLDLFTISEIDPVDLGRDFVERLIQERVGIEIDYIGNLTYTNEQEAEDFLSEAMFDSGVIVVTPYPQVEVAVRKLLSTR